MHAQLSLKSRMRIAVADLIALRRLALVEQEQRHRQLIAGVTELLGRWPGDPAQAEPFWVAF